MVPCCFLSSFARPVGVVGIPINSRISAHLPKKCEVFDVWLDVALDLASGFHTSHFLITAGTALSSVTSISVASLLSGVDRGVHQKRPIEVRRTEASQDRVRCLPRDWPRFLSKLCSPWSEPNSPGVVQPVLPSATSSPRPILITFFVLRLANQSQATGKRFLVENGKKYFSFSFTVG